MARMKRGEKNQASYGPSWFEDGREVWADLVFQPSMKADIVR
jgi:hypothetical protein